MLQRTVRDIAGKIWALPNTLAGIVLAALGCLTILAMEGRRPRITIGNNAFQFLDCPLLRSGKALAIGNVILYGRNCPPESFGAYGDPAVNVGLHEKAHTYQSQVLGIFFFPVYLCVGGFSGPAGNPLERAAQRYGSGRGSWWPWATPF